MALVEMGFLHRILRRGDLDNIRYGVSITKVSVRTVRAQYDRRHLHMKLTISLGGAMGSQLGKVQHKTRYVECPKFPIRGSRADDGRK